MPSPTTPYLSDRTARRVIDHVSMRSGVPCDVITSPGRKEPAVRARRRAARLFRRLGYSLPSIGWALKRDHTTILYGLRKDRLQA